MSSFQRQVCFNELSNEWVSEGKDVFSLFRKYVQTIKALEEKGFKGVRYEHGFHTLHKSGEIDIYRLQKDPVGRTIFDILLSTSRQPYIDPNQSEEKRNEMEDDLHETLIEDNWTFGIGFNIARHLDTVTISLPTHPSWIDGAYSTRRIGEEEKSGEVINIVSPGGTTSEVLNQFIIDRTEIELQASDLAPEKKQIHLRPDHGTAELTEMWERLRNNDYVVECINSLPFARNKSYSFIDKIKGDGKIEIRLMDCDPKYGMVIQTTGRNYRETEAIARIIEEKYS